MFRKITLMTFFFFSIVPMLVAAEPEWWTKQKHDCGLDPNLAYNDWVSQGSPCNKTGAKVSVANSKGNLTDLMAQLQSSPDDLELRKAIIKLVSAKAKKPAVSEDLDVLMGKAKSIIKDAKTSADYQQAVDVLKKASLLAPWVADIYYNLGTMQEKAEQPADAINSFNLYLLAKPNAKDRKKIKEKIGSLEYSAEKLEKSTREKNLANSFIGHWYCTYCGEPGNSFAHSIGKGCTASEFNGSYWTDAPQGHNGLGGEIEVESDGTLKLVFSVWSYVAGFYGGGEVYGVPQGPSVNDIHFELRAKDGTKRQIWSRMGDGGNVFWISGNRPLSGGDDAAHYSYQQWSRTK